jgi:hypothetical protein
MRKLGQPAIILGALLAVLASATALGDDTVSIMINNDGSDDIIVTVYDMNAEPPAPVILSQRINGFAWIPASVTASAAGTGHVRWTAIIAEPHFQHRCGHHEVRGLVDDDSVRISADSLCHE